MFDLTWCTTKPQTLYLWQMRFIRAEFSPPSTMLPLSQMSAQFWPSATLLPPVPVPSVLLHLVPATAVLRFLLPLLNRIHTELFAI